ncbi:MAG: ATP-binding protein [Desulfobacterales bacterium]
MERDFSPNGKADNSNWEVPTRADYSRLFRKFVLITIVSSVVPLLLLGWGTGLYYAKFAKDRMTEKFQERITQHKRTIELFLNSRMMELHLIAESYPLEYLNSKENLDEVFRRMNRVMKQEYGNPFTDMGVIAGTGSHLAYTGPYDLMDKTYSDTFWFKEVMEKGDYISDMFLGFRQVPHFIMAVSRLEDGRKWILRATINAEAFRFLVEDVKIGKSGEVYLINREGFFQTQPRFGGKIMDQASLPVQAFHDGLDNQIMISEGEVKQIVASVRLTPVPWMLVVRQDYDEAFSSVNHANYATLVVLHLSALAIFMVSYFSMRYMIRTIRERDEEKNHLNKQLLQTGKLASIGQLSAGVAHEVNNPLGIIMTERQILLDKAERTPGLDPEFRAQLEKSLSQMNIQLKRCKHITLNLLRFSRRTVSKIEEVDLNTFLSEIIDLRARDARGCGIKFLPEFSQDVRPIMSDPSQLQQIFLNLITNAIDAHEQKGYGSIRISTTVEDQDRMVNVTFADTGSGIRPEHLDRIFDPFFTTKPVGKGTGLGLSICYSIVKRLGGDITVSSTPGEGSRFSVLLPVTPPANLEKSFEHETENL